MILCCPVPEQEPATEEGIKEYDILKRKQLNYMYEMTHSNESLGAY